MSHIEAETSGGGTAILHDSPGDDDFSATPSNNNHVRMWTRGTSSYSAEARGFDINIGYATTDVDYARLWDTAGDDTLVSTKDYVVLRGDGFYAQASGFDIRDVMSDNGGNDIAQFVDSAGDDLVTVGTIATANQGSSQFASIHHDHNAGNETPRTFARRFSKVIVIGNSGGQNDIEWYGSLGFNFQRVGSWNILSPISDPKGPLGVYVNKPSSSGGE